MTKFCGAALAFCSFVHIKQGDNSIIYVGERDIAKHIASVLRMVLEH
jgi:hypothetical protein